MARAHPQGRLEGRGRGGGARFGGPDDGDGAELAAAPIVGVAYGYCGAPDQWWQQQVVAGLQRVGADRSRISELMTSYFELTELHIHPPRAGPRPR